MFQTGYKPLINLAKTSAVYGGLCKLWFIPKQLIAAWPEIDPLTQFLANEPILYEGASWIGPLIVPDKQLGFEEPMKIGPAGPYYIPKIFGNVPGDSKDARINIANLVWNEYVFLGKPRAGDFYVVIGNNENGLQVAESDFETGKGGDGNPGTKLTFSGVALEKAFILPYFSLINLILESEDGGIILTEDDQPILTP